jgi:two-component system cell cycle sensor histidine kinase/response regulator CckA
VISGSEGSGPKIDPDQLRSMSERYRMLYDQTPIMMKAVDANGHIIEANEAYIETLKYTRDEVIGRLSVDFVTDESREYVVNVVTPEVERSGSMRDIEVQMVTRDGEIIELAVVTRLQFYER